MRGPVVTLAANTAWSVGKFRLGLVRALQESGFQVVALAGADSPPADLPCELVPIRIERSGTNPVQDLRLLFELRGHYRSLRPVAALHFTSKLNIYGAVAAHALGIPSIGNITGLGSAFLGGGLVARVQQHLYRFALQRADRVFFQNPDDRDLFLRRGLVRPAHTALLPGSGIDLDSFSPRPKAPGGPFVFLMIARLIRDKGIFEYVEAARRLRKGPTAAEFRLVGFLDSGNPTSASARDLEQWNAEGLIDYRGPRDDVREEIARADCVVLPSYREGTPRTLLEAAAMARPVITTDAPGCRQVVEDGVTGLLCRVRDAADLAGKMERMLELPEAERLEMGRQGRLKMEREYDEAIVVRAYLQALQDLQVFAESPYARTR